MQRKLYWSGNDVQLTRHRNFKLSSSKWPLNIIKVSLFQIKVGVIWEIWLSRVIIWLKIGHLKRRNVVLMKQRQKNSVTQQLPSKFF